MTWQSESLRTALIYGVSISVNTNGGVKCLTLDEMERWIADFYDLDKEELGSRFEEMREFQRLIHKK